MVKEEICKESGGKRETNGDSCTKKLAYNLNSRVINVPVLFCILL